MSVQVENEDESG